MAMPQVGVVDGHAKGDSAEVEMVGREDEMNGAGDVRAKPVRQAMMLTKNLMIRRDAVHLSSIFFKMAKQPSGSFMLQN